MTAAEQAALTAELNRLTMTAPSNIAMFNERRAARIVEINQQLASRSAEDNYRDDPALVALRKKTSGGDRFGK